MNHFEISVTGDIMHRSMSETADRLNDIMVMIIGVQLTVVGTVFEDLELLLLVGPLFTLAVYTNELRRRK